MKILMLSPDAQMIDRRILQEARSLSAAGHGVTVLSGFECREPDAYEDRGVRVKRFVYDWRDVRPLKLAKKIGALTSAVAWPPLRVINYLRGGPNAFEAFVLDKVFEHDFDVVHVHDFPMLRTGTMAAKARGALLVYDSHEFYPVQSCFTPEEQKRYLALEGKLVKSCARVITVNPYIARMLADAHAIKEPMVVLNASELPAATARTLTPDDRRRARIAKGLPPDAFIFLYQGWLSGERNLEPMIEAMATQPPGITLLIVGYGAYESDLKALAGKSGVGDRVIFYGRVESNDLPALTMLCDVGVIPYRAVDEMHRYCSPNKLFEFIAAEIPILASDLPYLRDVIATYEIGWLGALDDKAAFADLVTKIAGDREGVAAASRNLPAAARQFNWGIEGSKVVKLYRQLAAEKVQSP